MAANGAQAVGMAAATDCTLILMDLQMPELDGPAAARASRAAPGGQAVPIVAPGAFALEGDRRSCLDAGMNGHVSKPIDVVALLQAVQRWLRTAAGTAGRTPVRRVRPARSAPRVRPAGPPAPAARCPPGSRGARR